MNEKLLNVLFLFAQEKQPEIRKFRICAAVVHRHKDIISLGFPRRKTHPMQARFGNNEHSIYLHAEIDAIIKARKVVTFDDEYALYIARAKRPSAQSKEFIMGSAKACIGCTNYIHHCGIKEIIYTTG